MANERWTKVFICIILLWKADSSQSITRHLGSDEYPNPDSGNCGSNGCSQSNGYKSCSDCCTCICNYGSYLTSQHRCMQNAQLLQECKFSFPDNENQIAFATSTHALKKGQKVAHCESKWQKCTTSVTDCVLVRSRTMYDNGNWTILWPLQSLVDIEIERTTGKNDTLKWKSKPCNAKKYDGLLISLGINCKVDRTGNRVASCLVTKLPGTFRVGTNPLTRTNCTAATASAKTSKATATSIQTRPTKSSQTNLTSQSTFETEHPRTNPSASKSQLVTAVSLSITGLLLLALFAVAVVIFKRRRKKASSRGSSGKEDNKTVTARSSLSQSPAALAMEANRNGNLVYSEEPPMFISHENESFYEEPSSEPVKSGGKVFPSFNTRGQNTAVNVNGGDANDCSGGKRPKIKSCSSAGEEAHSDDKIWLQDSLAIYSEPYPGKGSVDAIYDEPDVAARDSANALHGNDKNSEPVYMLYEPFHP